MRRFCCLFRRALHEDHNTEHLNTDTMASYHTDERELTRTLRCMNEQSASLILMVLCDNSLDLHLVEVESDNELVESRLNAVRCITGSPSRTDIARASRDFKGTFFTESDVISFSPDTLYDVCASILFNMNPSFLLQHCSLRFLYEKVRHEAVRSSAVNDSPHIIYVSAVHYEFIAARLADAIEKGRYRMSLIHPILQEEIVVDKVFQHLKLRQRNTHGNNTSEIQCKIDDRKYLLQWAVQADSVFLVNKLVTTGYHCSEREIIKGFLTCARYGSLQVMEHFIMHFSSAISSLHVKTAFSIAIDRHRARVADFLTQHGAELSDMSLGRLKKLFHDSGEDENVTLCEVVLDHVLGNHPVADRVRRVLWNTPSITFRDACNEILHIACNEGYMPLVEFLIDIADTNCPDQNGRTPIFNAVGKCSKAMFDLLVSNGADITVTDNLGNSILNHSCLKGNYSLVEKILPLFDINCRGYNGWTPVMNAAHNSKYEIFDLLMTKGADLTLTGNYGSTVFHLACKGGNVSIVQRLLPVFDLNSPGQYGLTPVMFAVEGGNTNVFDLLVNKGADLNLTDNFGDTTFHRVCRKGNATALHQLLPLFNINVRGYHGWTPVMNACYGGRKEIFETVLKSGADLALIDNYGNNMLHIACEGGNASIVEYLSASFDINSRGQNGFTPAMIAARMGTKEVFDLFVRMGADFRITDESGNAVLHHACQEGQTSIVERLVLVVDINTRGHDWWTPIMNAAYNGKKEVFDLLVAHGADLLLTGKEGYTLLHCACEGGNAAIVKCVFHLFDINVRCQNGQTPLTMSVANGHIDIFDHLVSHGADVTVVDDGGDDLLHLACEQNNLDMVKHVLPLCKVNARNKFGWTPAMLALVNGHENVFRYLVDEGADLTADDYAGDDLLTVAIRGGCVETIQQLTPAEHDIVKIEKWTPFMYQLAVGNNPLEDIEHGDPDLIQRDGFGDTLLHIASRGGNKQNVKHLLHSYDIDVRGRYGWTPLMVAARCGHLDVFQYLLSHQADLSLISDSDEDVLTLSLCGGHAKISKYLLTLPEFKARGKVACIY